VTTIIARLAHSGDAWSRAIDAIDAGRETMGDRKTGWYWVIVGDEQEIARYDANGGTWSFVGGYESEPDDGVLVISERIEPPTYWKVVGSGRSSVRI
jgi:hypothetical protein